MAADFLQKILADTREDVQRRKNSFNNIEKRAAQSPPPRDFTAALSNAAANGRFPVIAEIKHKSPSRGVLCAEFNPAALAADYAEGGAACLSVLTNVPYFGGDDEHLTQAKNACELPVLRKDFMVEEWQIYESRANGADAILLIAAALSDDEMRAMSAIAVDLGMTVLTEAHDESELERTLTIDGALIGINNRNLSNFNVSLQTCEELLPKAAGRLTVAESGIETAADVKRLSAAGARAFLIGETLMRASTPAAALRELFDGGD